MKKLFLLLFLLLQLSVTVLSQTTANNRAAGSSGEVDVTSFSSNLCSAISAVGATPTTLNITQNTTVDCAAVIPPTLILQAKNGAKLIKANSGTIKFQGFGLENPESQTALFSGFSASNITWTGAVFPAKLSSNLWESTSASVRLLNAVASLPNRQATIIVYPGTITSAGTITAGKSVYFTRGDYPNTYSGGGSSYTFVLESNTNIYGDGFGQTFIHESNDSPAIFTASGVTAYPYDGFNENISVKGITFVGNPNCPVDSSSSAVFLGNVVNGEISKNHFLNTHGFAAYVGGFSNSGNSAKNVFLVDNIVEGLQTQNMGTVGGQNVHISRNLFIVSIPEGASFVAVIDVEPNADTDGSFNIIISDNVFDGRMARSGWNGITVQKGYSNSVRNVKVINNLIIGRDLQTSGFLASGVNTATDVITSSSHGFVTGQPIYVAQDDNGNGGALPGGILPSPNFYGFAIRVSGDKLKLAATYANAVAGVALDITSQGAGYYVAIPLSRLANGIQIFGTSNSQVQNNTVQGAGQSCLDLQSNTDLLVENNNLTGCANGISLINVTNSEIKRNTIKLSGQPNSEHTNIVESETTFSVNTTAGSPLVKVNNADQNIIWWVRGKTITINGVDYVIRARDGQTLILFENAASTLTGTQAKIKWSNNRYAENQTSGVKLASGSKSIVIQE